MTEYNESVRKFTRDEDIKIINLKYLERKKYKEIAKIMNRTEMQISGRLGELIKTNEKAKSLHTMHLKTKTKVRKLRDEKIIMMHKQGMKRSDIAKELSVASQTVTNVVKRWNYENNLSES